MYYPCAGATILRTSSRERETGPFQRGPSSPCRTQKLSGPSWRLEGSHSTTFTTVMPSKIFEVARRWSVRSFWVWTGIRSPLDDPFVCRKRVERHLVCCSSVHAWKLARRAAVRQVVCAAELACDDAGLRNRLSLPGRGVRDRAIRSRPQACGALPGRSSNGSSTNSSGPDEGLVLNESVLSAWRWSCYSIAGGVGLRHVHLL